LRSRIRDNDDVALLKILEFPDPRLRTKALPITTINANIKALVNDMLETMYEAPGIGLAASQVNIHKRIIVIDISETRDEPLVLINPELSVSGEEVETDEGCLSVPGYYEPVVRKERATVKAIDENGVPFELNATGLLAICIQHENDHLNGKLFVDYLSPLKRSRIRKKLQKLGQHGQ
tara:strand:- start:251 stop:784 length:534 start_codon:yes stop_codon:yes gene_type:complete